MTLHAMGDSTPVETFSYLAVELDRLGIADLHVTKGVARPDARPPGVERVAPHLRKAFSRSLILNGSFDADNGDAAIAKGEADLIAYWHGILARCRHPLNTSVVEGVNNTIKVIKRRAYGYRDEEYFFLKIRAAFPGIPR